MSPRVLFTRLSTALGLGLLLLTFSGGAQACAICFSGTVVTPGQKLDSADQAVLAAPTEGSDGFSVIEVIKGDVSADAVLSESDVTFPATELGQSLDSLGSGKGRLASPDGRPLLLVRNSDITDWTFIGSVGAEYANWLRDLVATKRDGTSRPPRLWPSRVTGWSYLSDAEWRERLAVIAPQLESSEPFVKEIAFGELIRTPYAVMRTLRPRLDAATIEDRLDDPSEAARRSVNTLLVGIAGGSDAAARLEQRISEALRTGETGNLSALLAADLELRGPSRVDWVEATFFSDRSRTLPEINAALLALSVHGQADAAVPRSRIVKAYRRFIADRKPMAGFVAAELAEWEAWEATPDYVAIMRSAVVKDPADQFAILSYLKSSPLTSSQTPLPVTK